MCRFVLFFQKKLGYFVQHFLENWCLLIGNSLLKVVAGWWKAAPRKAALMPCLMPRVLEPWRGVTDQRPQKIGCIRYPVVSARPHEYIDMDGFLAPCLDFGTRKDLRNVKCWFSLHWLSEALVSEDQLVEGPNMRLDKFEQIWLTKMEGR